MLQTLTLLLPALVPSWRFFDEIAPSPRIEFAVLKTAQDTAAHWQEFRPRPARLSLRSMAVRLFWNARWNESLFLVSCAERLMEAPNAHSHHEILNRICAELGRHPGAGAAYVQFRLVVISRQGTALQKDIPFISPVYPVGGLAL